MPRFLRGLALVALVLLAGLAQAQKLPAGVQAVTAVEGIEEYRLANGLQLLWGSVPARRSTSTWSAASGRRSAFARR